MDSLGLLSVTTCLGLLRSALVASVVGGCAVGLLLTRLLLGLVAVALSSGLDLLWLLLLLLTSGGGLLGLDGGRLLGDGSGSGSDLSSRGGSTLGTTVRVAPFNVEPLLVEAADEVGKLVIGLTLSDDSLDGVDGFLVELVDLLGEIGLHIVDDLGLVGMEFS